MEEMKIFNNSEFGTLEVISINGKEYFPATLCATILGYSNPRDAISKHCRCVAKHDVPHPQNPSKLLSINVIPEGDLYRLITHSKLPAAERFESWIFDEVIPEIRQTGGYSYNHQITEIDIAKIVSQAVSAAVSEVIKYMSAGTTNSQIQENHSSIDVSCPIAQCKLETFPPEIVDKVDTFFRQMIERQSINFSYIARYCTANGYPISNPAVKRYFDKHFG